VGRHNTLDKLRGMALMQGLDTRDLILLSSGRISSEMLTKAAKMKVPVIVSRTSPTSLSVALAQAWRITLIGYARQSRMNVYTGEERLRVEA
jgi:FdhD protein